MNRRFTAPVCLLAAGVAAGVFAVVANDVTWKAIWIGVASTAVASGLVDGSAALEARRREQAVLDAVGERVGRVHQRLLWIVETVFDNAQGEARDVSQGLRATTGGSYNPQEPADVLPTRPKAAWIAQCMGEIDDDLEVVVALGAQTSHADRLVDLDASVRNATFITWARTASAYPLKGGEDVLGGQAADVVDVVQEQFRFFSRRNRPGWRYGQL